MATLEYCLKHDFVAPLNDKKHRKSENGSPTIWEHRKNTSLRNFETEREIKK